jgi:hypothetical protein
MEIPFKKIPTGLIYNEAKKLSNDKRVAAVFTGRPGDNSCGRRYYAP